MLQDGDVAFSLSGLRVSQGCPAPGAVACTATDPGVLGWASVTHTEWAKGIGKLYTHHSITGLLSVLLS